jgi:hypothetical protein
MQTSQFLPVSSHLICDSERRALIHYDFSCYSQLPIYDVGKFREPRGKAKFTR